MKLSRHSKIRMKERTNLQRNEMRRFFAMALKHGKSVQQIKNKKIQKYLLKKQKFNSRIRLYQDYVFIYSKNSYQLYTMYKLPEWLGDEK